MKIYFVRHTSVDVPRGVCYGQTDVSLKSTFEEEALVIKQELQSLQTDLVFSSPLSRCIRLAHFCTFECPILDARLMELNFGDWEYKFWDDVDMSIWSDDWVNTPAPNGESFAQMYQRVVSFFQDLKAYRAENIIVFTHAGVLRCAHMYWQGIDATKAFDLESKYGEIVKFEF